jgi:chaperonin GroES
VALQDIKDQASVVNLAEDMDEEKLAKIGMECKRGFEADERSREPWLRDTQEWLDLACQIRENKNWPWEQASNVKYPLISVAAMQFAARSYPSLVPGDGRLVKTRVIGRDPDNQKSLKAERVAKYMSWQFMYDMPRWEEDMDRLLLMIPVVGMMFKKTYYDPATEKNCSELVYCENFVVDYWTKDLESAERYSEIIYITERKLKERQKQGQYLNVDLGAPPLPTDLSSGLKVSNTVSTDSVMPYILIQQACWLDLDDDGIKEPYYVLFHKNSGKVLRIYARYTEEDVIVNKEGEIAGFKDRCDYVKFPFIPNPDGSFYDLGFGHLLGPLNESVNTLINQIIDAGTLTILQSGFLGKGFRVRMGDQPLQPGEWRVVNAVGDDLRKQIVPLPAKEPSKVLFELLGMLITSGKELASVAEIFVGKMPGQNTPATTTMATIEQGMKVFTAIYKRIYRALEKEFKHIYRLNGLYTDPNTQTVVLDEPIGPEDFNPKDYDICPSADPAAASQTEKLMKAQALLELLPLGTIDPVKVTMRVLEAQDQPNWQELIPGMMETGQPQIPPQQDPKMMEMQQKMEFEAQKHTLDIQQKEREMAMNQRSKEMELVMKEQEQQLKLQGKVTEAHVDANIAQQKQQIFMRDSANQMQVKQANHEQDMANAKEASKLPQPKNSTSTGGGKAKSPKQSSKKSGSGSNKP